MKRCCGARLNSSQCDQCRRRKSRCNGEMHCDACRMTGLQCSFGHVVKQTRGPAYVAHLEKRIADLEERLRQASQVSGMSDDDTLSPTQASSSISMAKISPIETSDPSLPSNLSDPGHLDNSPILACTENQCFPNSSETYHEDENDVLTSDRHAEYVDTITTEPRGKLYGLDILRQLHNLSNRITLRMDVAQSSIKVVEALDNSHITKELQMGAHQPCLPQKHETLSLITTAFSGAFHLWPFIDRTHVDNTIYRLYHTNEFGQEPRDRDDLALLYAVLALGQRFETITVESGSDCKRHGMSFFVAARSMVPLTHCGRSLTALQTALCMALYLKAASDQTLVHTYITAAAGAALRLGLHEQTPFFAQDETALRQRVWSTIRVLDTFISAFLGIPCAISQIWTHEQDAFPPLPSGSNSAELVAANAHAELATKMNQKINSMYHGRTPQPNVGLGPYLVALTSLDHGWEDLDRWARACPVLAQSQDSMTRAQLTLEYMHAYAQILLYSPFVHHITRSPPDIENTGHFYGKKCFEAALHAVKIAEILHQQGHFNEAYFFTIDVLAFAAMVLMLVETCCKEAQLVMEAMHGTRCAREILLELSFRNSAAAECWSALSACGSSSRAPRLSMGSLQALETRRKRTSGGIDCSANCKNICVDDVTNLSNRPSIRDMRSDSAINLGTRTCNDQDVRGVMMALASGMDPTLSMPHMVAMEFEQSYTMQTR
ncbi:hypothetical protein AC579_9583 [Pseudocercospora musae]|uniref:Zn(2)-C6 fungal-type domain-containing protein n=1 Tax=Pseudocercospora musae TaxID=113226 RepID=A0A139IT48_9PEZI|nr:hypothetical protein AC579_9583 [Pseudocercospora musae]